MMSSSVETNILRKMRTKILSASKAGAIEAATQLLRSGNLVAYPTDTLYGIGVDVFNFRAIERLYEVKARPRHKGIPVLLADPNDLDFIVEEVSNTARNLIDHYWPGPLTLVLPRSADLPENISPDTGVAVRIPDNSIARNFIRACGGAVATTSANRSGEQPARDAQEAMASLKGSIAAVLDGGLVHYRIGSTILDCRIQPPKLLREGPIKAETLPVQIVIS
jgi:L-threonylcarbamoyladenylate synthase